VRLADQQTTILLQKCLETHGVIGREFASILTVEQGIQGFLLMLRQRGMADVPERSVIHGRHPGEALRFFGWDIVKRRQDVCETFLENLGQRTLCYVRQCRYRAILGFG
jgi:hypothetical protein